MFGARNGRSDILAKATIDIQSNIIIFIIKSVMSVWVLSGIQRVSSEAAAAAAVAAAAAAPTIYV